MADAKQGGRAKDSAMAAHLVKMGIHHGKRRTKPNPNSGGTTMRTQNVVGSAAYQRLQAKRGQR